MLKPLRDLVLIEVLKPDEKAGRFLIPEAYRDKRPPRGVVRDFGPGLRNADGVLIPVSSVKVGDIVHFEGFQGYEILVAGKEFKLLKELDILAVEEHELALPVEHADPSVTATATATVS